MPKIATAEGPGHRRIVLLGLFGVGNVGNDATLDVTLFHLRQRVRNPQILCVCGNPDKVRETFGIPTVRVNLVPPWSFWRVPSRLVRYLCVVIATLVTEPFRRSRVAKELGGAQQLLVVGTGILDDFGELPWRVPLWLWRWCVVARRIGARIEFVSVGAGPIDNPINRHLMMNAVRTSERRTFRDRTSKEYMTSLGLDTSSDTVVPDLVFGFPPERLPSARAAQDPPRTIGVGLMAYYGWSNDRKSGKATYEAYISKMSRFVSWLLDSNYAVRLLIGQQGADERAVTDLCHAVTALRSGAVPVNLVSASIDSFDALLREIAHTDAVVATRYHNVIGAILLGRPVISIGYAHKFEALMQDMGLAAYCQRTDELDVTRLIEQFRSLMSEYSRIAGTIQEGCRVYRTRVGQVYDALWQ